MQPLLVTGLDLFSELLCSLGFTLDLQRALVCLLPGDGVVFVVVPQQHNVFCHVARVVLGPGDLVTLAGLSGFAGARLAVFLGTGGGGSTTSMAAWKLGWVLADAVLVHVPSVVLYRVRSCTRHVCCEWTTPTETSHNNLWWSILCGRSCDSAG